MKKMNANNLVRVAATVAATCVMQASLATTAVPTIQVFPQAVVQADRVLLADLASLSGVEPQQAQAVLAVEVCSAPAAGNVESIDVERIRKALAGADVNLASLCISGAAECRIFRPAEPANEPAVLATGISDTQATRAAEADPWTLEAAVRDFLAKRLAELGGRIEVRFGAANKTILGLAGKDMTFRIQPRSQSLLGLVTLDVDVVETGQVSRTIPVLAEVALFKSVVITRGPVNRGAAIRPEDVELQERRFTRTDDIGLASTTLAVNRQARRYIDRGEMVSSRDVQPLPLVRRGEYVTVWLKRGSLTVRGSAKALKEGAQGDRIEVKAEPGGQVYPVIVTGLKTVEADAGATLLSCAD